MTEKLTYKKVETKRPFDFDLIFTLGAIWMYMTFYNNPSLTVDEAERVAQEEAPKHTEVLYKLYRLHRASDIAAGFTLATGVLTLIAIIIGGIIE